MLADPGAARRADPDPAANVRRLVGAGHRVLIIDGSADISMVAPSLAAGAHGYLTRDHDTAALARILRGIVSGGTSWSLGPTRAPGASGVGRPPLSEREHSILMAYVSGPDPGFRGAAPGHQPRDGQDVPQAGQGQVSPDRPARLHQARSRAAGPCRLHRRHEPADAGGVASSVVRTRNCSHGIWLRNLEWLRPDNGTGVGLARLGCGSRYLNRPLWQPRQRIFQDLLGSAMTIRAGIVQECVLPLLRASGKRWS